MLDLDSRTLGAFCAEEARALEALLAEIFDELVEWPSLWV